MKKVVVFTGTRAEYGLLYPLLKKMQSANDIELGLIVSGMHLSPQYGETWKLIQDDGFVISAKVEMQLSTDTSCGVAKSMGVGIIGFADVLDRIKPQCLVVLGDRYEALAVAQVATVMDIPIAHIHGGEITEGAYDDSIRHAITKLSYLHFVACEEYKNRVIQLGEHPHRVWNVGALGVENIKSIDKVSIENINREFEINLTAPFFIVTYHPVTVGDEDSFSVFNNILRALDKFDDYQVLFTYPNSDNGGYKIIQCIEEYVSGNPGRAFAVKSLGLVNYISAVARCSAVIGNSSSGVIEVPSLSVPTVNVGVRQKGRLMSSAVINTTGEVSSIISGIGQAIKNKKAPREVDYTNPYEGKNTSDKILNVLRDSQRRKAKRFFDIN